MPPALATKSGAHRTPRARRRSATPSAASWLFAAPATTGACAGAGPSRGPGPRRARTAPGRRPRRAAPRRGSSRSRRDARASRALALVDVGHDEPGARVGQELGEPQADVARGRRPRRARPARSSLPSRAPPPSPGSRRGRRAPCRGSGRPTRRASRERPQTCAVASRDDRHVRGRGADVLGRDVRGRRGARRSSPKSRSASRRRSASSSVPGGRTMTPLPPPRGRPATADL